MYTCDRCGTSFGRQTPVVESCPRCLARDGVRVGLAFKLFHGVERTRAATPVELRPTTSLDGGLQTAVRKQLAADQHRAA